MNPQKKAKKLFFNKVNTGDLNQKFESPVIFYQFKVFKKFPSSSTASILE